MIAQAKPLPLSYGLKHSVVQTINISWSIQRDFFDIPKKSTVFHKLAGSWIEQVVRKKNIDLKAINGRCCLNQIVIYESGNHYIQCEHKPQNKGFCLRYYVFLIGLCKHLLHFLNRTLWFCKPSNSCRKRS